MFKFAPNRWDYFSFLTYVKDPPMEDRGDVWIPARPLGLYSIRNRIRLAWAVFTGKADALFWEFK